MNRDKQIEDIALEMASEVRACLVECECKDCGWYKTDNCPLIDYTKSLAEKGYRKSVDVAREIFSEIEKMLSEDEQDFARLEKLWQEGVHDYARIYVGDLRERFAELRKKYESEGADDVG